VKFCSVEKNLLFIKKLKIEYFIFHVDTLLSIIALGSRTSITIFPLIFEFNSRKKSTIICASVILIIFAAVISVSFRQIFWANSCWPAGPGQGPLQVRSWSLYFSAQNGGSQRRRFLAEQNSGQGLTF